MRRTRNGQRKLLASDVGENGLLERILSGFSIGDRGLISVGPGDDAAVIELGGSRRLVITMDMLVEGTHFSLPWSYPEALGFKSVAANLSDVAAMGGRPIGIVISIGIPRGIAVAAVEEVYRGVAGALSLFGGELLGGDTVRANRITVCISAIGILCTRKPVLRSGATPGDAVCVTGVLGESHAGLLLLKKYSKTRERSRKAALDSWAGRDAGYFKRRLPGPVRQDGVACVSKHLRPSPRVEEAEAIAAFQPSAMIDISDGLVSDSNQIARASRVDLSLFEKRIPVSLKAARVAAALGLLPCALAVSSGEEYEILFTVRRNRVAAIARTLLNRFAVKVTAVGEVTGRGGTVSLLDSAGRKTRLTGGGFRHF